jgi:hypothetical protein
MYYIIECCFKQYNNIKHIVKIKLLKDIYKVKKIIIEKKHKNWKKKII